MVQEIVPKGFYGSGVTVSPKIDLEAQTNPCTLEQTKMTDKDFADAKKHQISVLDAIQVILKANKMSLRAGENLIYLSDEGRDIDYTGLYLEEK